MSRVFRPTAAHEKSWLKIMVVKCTPSARQLRHQRACSAGTIGVTGVRICVTHCEAGDDGATRMGPLKPCLCVRGCELLVLPFLGAMPLGVDSGESKVKCYSPEAMR